MIREARMVTGAGYTAPQKTVSSSERQVTDISQRTCMILSAVRVHQTTAATVGFNMQTNNYVNCLATEQTSLNQRNAAFLARQYETREKLTATVLRNKSDWNSVKQLVVRDELMKLQVGKHTDLPLPNSQIRELQSQLEGLDLSDMENRDVRRIINNILKPNDQIYLDALKDFKQNGIADPCLQSKKLDQLAEYLEKIDYPDTPITKGELKHIKANYIEKLEIHHRTSISSDPTKQSNMDNLDTLNTTQHDQKHIDSSTGKTNYRKPVREHLLDRKNELKVMNRGRVLKNEVKGLGISILIGAGIGLTMGFIVNLAQRELNPESLKYAFANGAKAAGQSAVSSAVSYGIGRTAGMKLSETLSAQVVAKVGDTVAEETVKQICSMGVVGSLTIIAFSTWQFVKMKHMGFDTRECIIRTGKSAGLSFTMLTLSVIAQGIWGGPAGIIVSVTAGIITTGYTVYTTVHDRKLRKDISMHFIKLCEPFGEGVGGCATD